MWHTTLFRKKNIWLASLILFLSGFCPQSILCFGVAIHPSDLIEFYSPPAPEDVYSEQDDFGEVSMLIQEGIDFGLHYLRTDDKKSKKESRARLDRAKKMMEKAVRKNHDCEKCYTKLAQAQFYQAYFGFKKDYDDCLKTTSQGLERFAESRILAFYEGYALYNSKQYAEASKSLNYFLILSYGDPEAENQVKEVLNDAQQYFLNNWNQHTDYFESKAARIDTYDPNSYVPKTLFQVTPQWELETGSQAYNQLKQEAPEVNDPELTDYLNGLVNKLVSRTPGPYTSYKVTVLQSPQVNAVTPPGHIIIYTGLLTFADNEAQLVGVLAHELAHNYAHHSSRRFISATRAQGISQSIIQAINPQDEMASLLTQLGAKIGLDLYLKAYSRNKEKEADLYGAHIIFNAGYGPTALSEFFLKLYKHNPKQPPKFLSTHPPVQDRMLYLTDYLESFPLDRETRVDTEMFRRIKARYPSGISQEEKERRALPPPINNHSIPRS